MAIKKQGDNPHAEHRKRVKEKFANYGIDVFAEHEVLEMALFFSIPYGDTNELAHDLIKEFGSVAAVCNAPYDDLLKVKGVGPHTATQLKFLAQFSSFYVKNRWQDKVDLSSTQMIKKYIKTLYVCEMKEAFYMICLNSRNRLISGDLIAVGSIQKVEVQVPKVVENALKRDAVNVILVHNHPAGHYKPSINDIHLTRACHEALSFFDIKVIDHAIYYGDEVYLFTENDLMNYIDKRD